MPKGPEADAFQAGYEKEIAEHLAKEFKGAEPPGYQRPIIDGDATADEHAQGCWVVSIKSTQPPHLGKKVNGGIEPVGIGRYRADVDLAGAERVDHRVLDAEPRRVSIAHHAYLTALGLMLAGLLLRRL